MGDEELTHISWKYYDDMEFYKEEALVHDQESNILQVPPIAADEIVDETAGQDVYTKEYVTPGRKKVKKPRTDEEDSTKRQTDALLKVADHLTSKRTPPPTVQSPGKESDELFGRE